MQRPWLVKCGEQEIVEPPPKVREHYGEGEGITQETGDMECCLMAVPWLFPSGICGSYGCTHRVCIRLSPKRLVTGKGVAHGLTAVRGLEVRSSLSAGV